MFEKEFVKKAGIFAGGVLFGTAGVKILGSADAKKFYVNCLAAGLRARDSVMTLLPTFRRMRRIFLPRLRRLTGREKKRFWEKRRKNPPALRRRKQKNETGN